jgi:DNA-binding LacI/PurR family transcriptional regulator
MPTPKAITKVRLSDIAQRTNVSVATVSMALQNHPAIKHATRIAIHGVAREMGYQKPGVVLTPGFTLGSGNALSSRHPIQLARPLHMGYIAADKAAAQIHEENFAPLVHVLVRQTTRMGVRMQMASITIDTPLPETQAQVQRFADGLDGLLVCGEVRRPLLGILQKLALPFVVLGACAIEPTDPEAWTLHKVSFDTIEMARTATLHHLSRGKKRIALMNGSIAGQKGFWTDLWTRGYHMALCEAGITPDPRLAIPYRLGEGNESWTRRLTANPAKPDAVVWADMGMAQSAWPLLSASTLRLTREDHVLGGQKHMVQARGFDGFPMVMENNASLAKAGILTLKALISSAASNQTVERDGGMSIHIPFETANLNATPIP